MKSIGIGLIAAGGLGMMVGALAEASLKNDILLSIDFGVLDHRMMIALVGGFLFLAGIILYAVSEVMAAVNRQTAVIQEAINTPDVQPVEPVAVNRDLPVAPPVKPPVRQAGMPNR